MTTFVRKIDASTVSVISIGNTTVLSNGTKIPFDNLERYSPAELLAYNIFAFELPTPPQGKVIQSIGYVASPGGVDQVPVYVDAPAAPPLQWPPYTIVKALQSINRAKAALFMSKMDDGDRAVFTAKPFVAENDALLISALAEPSVNITLAALKTAIAGLP